MPNKLALFINHNIFLRENQFKELETYKSITTVGYNIPVWVNAVSTKTTEPAEEIFCEYKVSSNENCEKEEITINRNGYSIILPEKSNNKKPREISFEFLSKMDIKERQYYERKRKRWLERNPEKISLELLLRTKSLRFKIKKLDKKFKKIDAIADIQHSIAIKSIDVLINSLN